VRLPLLLLVRWLAKQKSISQTRRGDKPAAFVLAMALALSSQRRSLSAGGKMIVAEWKRFSTLAWRMRYSKLS
jgi:hypothetical protein